MQENYNIITNASFSGHNATSMVKLYIRHVPSKTKSNKAIILLNSRTLCVESSMGIAMGTTSFADYLADNGIHAFLLDMRGFGMSSVVEEQTKDSYDDITKRLTIEDYYSDISRAVDHIKQMLNKPEISILGFSFAASIVVGYSNKNPGVFKNLVLLNAGWKRYKTDTFGYTVVSNEEFETQVPYSEITMDKINERLLSAQPAGKNFIEPLWYDEALNELVRCHKTYNKETNSWKVAKFRFSDDFFTDIGALTNITQRVLLLTSQYDIENPYYVSNRLYKDLYCARPYLRTIPNATHLCIWETQRHFVYESTLELIK